MNLLTERKDTPDRTTVLPVPRCELLVVIVNYRSAALCVQCLKPLMAELEGIGGSHVVVVDNASPDDSADRLREEINAHKWEKNVTFLPAVRNGGFAWGNNEALRLPWVQGAKPRHVLLLNPDTIVRPGAITNLIVFMRAHPGAGIAGSRLEWPDGEGQSAARRFPTIFGEFESACRIGLVRRLLRRWVIVPPERDHPHQTDWVVGAAMLVRWDVLEQVGLLDEGYFMYYEEVDFCFRARRAGWECWFVPESRVVHLVGKSSGVTDTSKPRRRLPAYWFESKRRFFRKNYGALYGWCAAVAWTCGYLLMIARTIATRRPSTEPPMMLWDFIRYNILLLGRTFKS